MIIPLDFWALIGLALGMAIGIPLALRLFPDDLTPSTWRGTRNHIGFGTMMLAGLMIGIITVELIRNIWVWYF